MVSLIPFHKEKTEAEGGSAAFWVSVKAYPLFEICPLNPHVALAAIAQRPPDFGIWSQRAPFSRELRLCTSVCLWLASVGCDVWGTEENKAETLSEDRQQVCSLVPMAFSSRSCFLNEVQPPVPPLTRLCQHHPPPCHFFLVSLFAGCIPCNQMLFD